MIEYSEMNEEACEQQQQPSTKRQCFNQANLSDVDFVKLMEILDPSSSSSEEEPPPVVRLSKPPVMLSQSRPYKRISHDASQMIQLSHPQTCFRSCLTTIISGTRNILEAHACMFSVKLGFIVQGECSLHHDPKLGISISNIAGLSASRLLTTSDDERYSTQRNIDCCDGVLILKNKSDPFLNDISTYASFGIWGGKICKPTSGPPKPVLTITSSLQAQFGCGTEQILLPSSTWLDDINQVYNFLMINKIRCLYITGNDDDMDIFWYERAINFLRISLDRFKTI